MGINIKWFCWIDRAEIIFPRKPAMWRYSVIILVSLAPLSSLRLPSTVGKADSAVVFPVSSKLEGERGVWGLTYFTGMTYGSGWKAKPQSSVVGQVVRHQKGIKIKKKGSNLWYRIAAATVWLKHLGLAGLGFNDNYYNLLPNHKGFLIFLLGGGEGIDRSKISEVRQLAAWLTMLKLWLAPLLWHLVGHACQWHDTQSVSDS